MSENNIKVLSSRGKVLKLDNSGSAIIENYNGLIHLTRAEAILWFAARYDVVTESALCDRYYRTIMNMGITAPDIVEPFTTLLNKGGITFGRDNNAKDAIYRMFCQGIPTASGNFNYTGNNITMCNDDINFEPVIQQLQTEVPAELAERSDYLARMIANEKWIFPELVRNIDKCYPSSVTRDDIILNAVNSEPTSNVIPLFDEQPAKPLKELYYQSDIGHEIAILLSRLIIARRIFLM